MVLVDVVKGGDSINRLCHGKYAGRSGNKGPYHIASIVLGNEFATFHINFAASRPVMFFVHLDSLVVITVIEMNS